MSYQRSQTDSIPLNDFTPTSTPFKAPLFKGQPESEPLLRARRVVMAKVRNVVRKNISAI